MSYGTAARLFSIALTALFFATLHDRTLLFPIIASVGFGHYTLALWYSRRRVAALARTPSAYPAFALLTAFGVGLYMSGISILVYFIFHHVFNEVYARDRVVLLEAHPWGASFRTSAVVLNAALFLAAFRSQPLFQYTRYGVTLAALLAAYAAFFICLAKVRGALSRRELVDHCAFEIAGAGIVAVTFFVTLNALTLVIFHFVVWALIPVSAMRRAGRPALARYVALTALVTAASVAISPVGFQSFRVDSSAFAQAFFLASFLHISWSMALSDAHPAWIRRLFAPRPTPRLEPSPAAS